MDKMSKKDQLYYVLKTFLKGEYQTTDFCDNYERIYNLELDKKVLNTVEKESFEKLFNTVVYFSEFPEDRKKYSGYKNENDIQEAAEEAAKTLGLSL